jgi:putative membrane protein
MVLNCCAADAQPVKIGLAGQIPLILQPDTWLEVTGTYTSKQTKDPVNDGVIPFINISQVRPVPAPPNQYED